ncbi:MAG: VapE domain-containing protein [Psychroserpens sp.]|uniref:VapE domain-containing protein n=1 Tax=Psychroserpens sp. TaxID=2020870 RepID=UPI0030033AF4
MQNKTILSKIEEVIDSKHLSTNDLDSEMVGDSDKSTNITTVFHQAEEYISSKYNLRFNTLSLDIESKTLEGDQWISCNENSLWVEMQKSGIRIGQNSLKAILKSDFMANYNPLESYFKNIQEWDRKTDYISQYANYIKLEAKENKDQFLYHFKKWCVRSVKCALIKNYFNKQAFVLTDDGKGQNIGKSTWCRNLCPKSLSEYIAEDISNNDKDTRILICKNFLINMDELAALSKKEINQLKSLFSKDQINDRLPYASKNTIIPRVASFIGSTNMSTFLHDETGSVRWLCFVIDGIDWKYKEEFNVDKLWSQAYALSKDDNFIAELSREDIAENERRNDKFQYLSTERELLEKYFENPSTEGNEFMTSTDIRNYIKIYSTLNVNEIQMGKALKACKYTRKKAYGRYGYYMMKKSIVY